MEQLKTELLQQLEQRKKKYAAKSEQELKRVPVRITLTSSELIATETFVEFETDVDRVVTTLEFHSTDNDDLLKQKSMHLHSLIYEWVDSDELFSEELCTLIINYLVTIQFVRQHLLFSVQPICFNLFVVRHDSSMTRVIACEYEQWLLSRNQFINQLKNTSKF